MIKDSRSTVSLPCRVCGRSLTVIGAGNETPENRSGNIVKGRPGFGSVLLAWRCTQCGEQVVKSNEQLAAAHMSALRDGRRRIDWAADFRPAK